MFLERKSYRRRRMMDALRLVAVLGVVLWLIPVIWPSEATDSAEPLKMSRALYYVFGVWAGLILLSALLALFLRDKGSGPETETKDTAETDAAS